jgi:hypothetical protein
MRGNKGFLFFVLILANGALTFVACDGDPVIPREYTVDFPALPVSWGELMGNPHWRLVWLNPQGVPQVMETDGGGKTAITSVLEWATPVLAFPFWPGRGIRPGEMRPAGGLFPFDAPGNTLRLSWQGGVEAWFYRELAAALDAEAAGQGKRRPEYFDWPRFRALLQSEAVPNAVREDPWRADWRGIAAETVKSGFDRRRIKVQPEEELLVPREALGETTISGVPFFGPSPFAGPLFPEPGAGFRFMVTLRSDTYVSPGGILRVSKGAWIWNP